MVWVSISVMSISRFSILQKTSVQHYCKKSDEIYLNAPEGFDSYAWNTGDSNRVLYINSPSAQIDEWNVPLSIPWIDSEKSSVYSYDGTFIDKNEIRHYLNGTITVLK